MYSVKKCGVKFKPPTLVITYFDKSTSKMRYRSMPIRNFRINSDPSEFAEQMKKNQRHRSLLSDISVIQIERLLLVIKKSMQGLSLNESIEAAKKELSLDPTKDLNKLNEDEVNKAKRIMDETFLKKQIKPDDDNFEYDIEVNFDDNGKKSSWDSDSNDED